VSGSGLQARTSGADAATVQLSSLPAEAQQTDRLIRSGGPFPYAKDGTVFGNRERLLPAKRGATTANTPCRRRDRATGEPAASSAAANARPNPEACYLHRRPLRELPRIVQ
jgi:ribonuclease T1